MQSEMQILHFYLMGETSSWLLTGVKVKHERFRDHPGKYFGVWENDQDGHETAIAGMFQHQNIEFVIRTLTIN